MQEAQKLAEEAQKLDEVPVGAVIVSEHKEILGVGLNDKESTNNPCGHAEINAIIAAGKNLKDWRLCGASMFVTLEPCTMCLGAIVHARLEALYFGAFDKKAGSLSLGYSLYNDRRLNHNFKVYGGINQFENSKMLSDFFKARRAQHKK